MMHSQTTAANHWYQTVGNLFFFVSNYIRNLYVIIYIVSVIGDYAITPIR